MAKKISSSEQKNDSKELKDQTLREVVEETHEQITKESEAEDTKPVASMVEESKEDVKEVEKEIIPPAIYKEAIKKELQEEVSKEVTEKIVKSLAGKTEEEIPLTPWEKEGRTPTYKEALDYNRQLLKDELRAEQEADAKRIADEQKTAQDRAEDSKKQWNTYWDEQIDELTRSGKLPKVEDAKSKEDVGVKSRQALFEAMVKVNTQRIAEGKSQITSLKEIYYEHYTDPTKQPAGDRAPVAGKVKSGSGTQKDTSAYTAEDRKKSLGQILREVTGLA